MRRQIRSSVFETNSSSTHAICISKKRVDLDKLRGTTVHFFCGTFGWEVDEYNTLEDRASYLYQAILDLNYDDVEKRSEMLNRIVDILGKYDIDCYFKPPETDRWGFNEGYIDHANQTEEFVEAVLHNENRLLEYLFGDSIIFTGNDNDEIDLPLDDISEKDYEIYYKGN